MHLYCLRLDCCRPILLEHAAVSHARASFVLNTVHQMESSHPDAVSAMLAHAASMFVVGPDGTARSAGSGRVMWKPRLASAQITEAFADRAWGFPSAAAWAIGAADHFTTYSQPYCAGLPAAVLEIVAAEPFSAVGLSYQCYVRSTYLPGVRRIAAVLREHAAAIEWPSVAWLKKTFPGRARTDGADSYLRTSLAGLHALVGDVARSLGRRRVRCSCRLTVAPTARRLRRHVAWDAASLDGALHMHRVSVPNIPVASRHCSRSYQTAGLIAGCMALRAQVVQEPRRRDAARADRHDRRG